MSLPIRKLLSRKFDINLQIRAGLLARFFQSWPSHSKRTVALK